MDALVVEKITMNLPNFRLSKSMWPHLEGLNLADPQFNISQPIDALIGADLYISLITGETIIGPKGTPSAINSRLGWLLSGPIYSEKAQSSVVNCHAVIDSELNSSLQKFWQVESVPESLTKNSCEDSYVKTVSRDSSGRYIVDLPFTSEPTLSETKFQALKRFHLLESKFRKDFNYKRQYAEFMNEYLSLNHMELVPASEENTGKYYLPHFGVVREDSTTTKLRVVFDASSKDSKGRSLNDFLEVGPKLLPELFNILIHFRSFKVGFSADIEKMFRQILVNPKFTDYQRILWRFEDSQPISTYRLLTVTYGTASAPFLAIRTLQKLAEDNKNQFPEVFKAITKNFFMDDLLCGAQSLDEARSLIANLNEVMESGGFFLRKWSSNTPDAISALPKERRYNNSDIEIQDDETVRLLGLVWNTASDKLQLKIAQLPNVHTKRELLSVVARIFDPLGILSPTTILLKIMMQDLWKEKRDWDDQIPSQLLHLWNEFYTQIEILKDIEIPRCMNTAQNTDQLIQLHGFCDGSGKAYAAVIYLKVILKTGEISVSFVAAKTRVNPIKQITLPRIELCSALLLAQLCCAVLESLPITVHDIYLWSVSPITLSWINAPPSKGNQFVFNRANKIKSLIPKAKWNHIPGNTNPADCASRGILPAQLLTHKLWWSGPPWLKEPQTITPFEIELTPSNNSTESESAIQVTNVTNISEFLLKFSSFMKLSRVMAWCNRFINNSNPSKDKISGCLTSKEISQSINKIVKIIQHHEYSKELNLLKQNKSLPTNHKFLSLNVFLDVDGIIRVGGRLSRHQSLTSDHKHPMLLPKHHAFTRMLIRHYHEKNLHAGAQLVLSLLRQKYWFVSGRSTVRLEINKCLTCKKLKAKSCQQQMGNLPVDRITQVRPFSKVGIDFAGPFLTKPNVTRSKLKIKSYISVFICMCTKAVHIEVVTDLSSQAFLAALRRFIGRRGLPTDIYSDNGRNFVGVSKYLKELFAILRQREIQDFSSSNSITWHFIPPYSPHFGGLWEAAVKLTKKHLLKVSKSSILTFEELYTLMCQIEACINSRPLTPLSADPSDIRALTPGHFVIGAPLLEIPDSSESSNLLLSARWSLIQKQRQQFWKRWSRDYLHHLQQRPKWTVLKPNLQVGDLVIVHDSTCPPMLWRLGRITETHPGPDNLIRVVSIRTQYGIIKRPISKVTLLNNDN